MKAFFLGAFVSFCLTSAIFDALYISRDVLQLDKFLVNGKYMKLCETK